MFELVKNGGLLMIPIILCSIVALGIIIERFWSLRREKIVPGKLVQTIWDQAKKGQMNHQAIKDLRDGSPLGRILAAGLLSSDQPREVMKESIEETGQHAVLELERFLNSLGTIATITPLLGLLGTVVGMIQVFDVMTDVGVGNPGDLAGGISKALVTTAAGIATAIPSLGFYRFFRGRVKNYVLDMEQESLKLVNAVQMEKKTKLEKAQAQTQTTRKK